MATILIIDDRATNRMVLKAVLENTGHRLIEADGGEEGLRVARAERPDLAIVDILMPRMDGYQFVQAARADPDLAAMAVVFYSATYREAEALALARRCGVAHLLTKPAEPEQILQVVREMLDGPPPAPAAVPAEEFQKQHQRLLTTKVFEKDTELESVERKLERLAVQGELILNTVAEGIYGLDLNGRTTFVNPAAARMVGYTPDELLGQSQHDLIHHTRADGTPNPRDECHIYRAFREGVTTGSDDEVFWRKDGTSFPVEFTSAPLVEQGATVGAVVTFRDITARREAERQLRQQAAMLDRASDAILIRDPEHRLTYWNQGAERIYGWTAAEAIGQNVFELLFDPDARPALLKYHERLLADGEWSGELRPRARDGKRLVMFSRWTLLRDAADRPTGTLVINTDVTETKQLEAQYLRAQRLESLGTLAGGIAHDLNNVLTPIMMALEFLKLKVRDKADAPILDTLATSAHRGAGMVKQILAFARGAEGEKIPVQLRHVVAETRAMLEHTLPKGIAVRAAVAADLWPVLGDATQLGQVLMNLCVNARDAMPRGGTLTLEARNAELDESYARMHPAARPGWYVELAVADTGVGIPADVRDRIFDPFFTTKAPGKGTGLGLATVVGIAKGHGGFVTVDSEVGRGSRFAVYLPAVGGPAGGGESKPAAALPAGRGEVVLVVDDEAAIREVTAATLEANGYRALTATDGAEAVAVFAEHRAEVRAVVTDVMMPVMDGPATIRALRRMAPDLPVLAATGLAADGRAAEATAAGARAVLRKPFTADVLLAALNEALGRSMCSDPTRE